MTDLRPRLPRDQTGVAFDALAIGETYIVTTPEDRQTAHQIGPFESDVVLRLYSFFGAMLGTTAEAIATYCSAPENGPTDETRVFDGVARVPEQRVEFFHLTAGDTLFVAADDLSVTIMK